MTPIDKLAIAIGETLKEMDPSLTVDGFVLRYPEQSDNHGRTDFDLRKQAEATVRGCTYYV